MAEQNHPVLNDIYREISEQLGMETALEIFRLFRGQQICFPLRFFHPEYIRQLIVQEYDGKNIKALSIKYAYSEKSIRRILREAQQTTEAETRQEETP